MNKPWVALGGGGYHPVNVARAWTLAWSIMRGQELGQESLPASFQATLRGLGHDEKWLRDEDHQEEEAKWQRANYEAKATIRAVQETIFPFFNIHTDSRWF
jgi:acetoin utilization protein AcuC